MSWNKCYVLLYTAQRAVWHQFRRSQSYCVPVELFIPFLWFAIAITIIYLYVLHTQLLEVIKP